MGHWELAAGLTQRQAVCCEPGPESLSPGEELGGPRELLRWVLSPSSSIRRSPAGQHPAPGRLLAGGFALARAAAERAPARPGAARLGPALPPCSGARSSHGSEHPAALRCAEASWGAAPGLAGAEPSSRDPRPCRRRLQAPSCLQDPRLRQERLQPV